MTSGAAKPLPMRIEEIDSEWLTRALRTRVQGVTVRGVEIVDVVHGTCTKIRLRLDLDDFGKSAGIPELVMLKGGFESHSRPMSHVHLSEVRGYRDVFPIVSLATPECYFADYEDGSQQGIVIMEDLVERGVEFCSALRPQSFEQAARRLTALAQFHAQTWDTPKEGGRWNSLPEAEPGLREYMNQYLLKPDEWRRFVDSPRGAATSVRFHDLEEMVTAFDRLTVFSRRLPHCVLHGDTHLGNLYEYADGTPGFLDSMTGRGPAMRDLTYYITCALDTADRRRWEGALLQHYLGELRDQGVKPPQFDDALEQFAAFLLDGHIIFMVNESFYQPEAVNTAYTARFSAAMIDHDTLRVLERLGGPGS